MKCDQCEAVMINGTYCHERGCPNAGRVYDPEREQWIEYVECPECGDEVEEGEECACARPVDMDDERSNGPYHARRRARYADELPESDYYGG